jgi:hypothetical protein
MSAGRQEPRAARKEALRRASVAAAAVSGFVGAKSGRLDELAARLRDLEQEAVPRQPDDARPIPAHPEQQAGGG